MSDRDPTRRTVLRAGGLAAVAGVAGLAGCSGSGGGGGGEETTEGGDETPTPTEAGEETTESTDGGESKSFDGWFDNTDNYDGVVDETGSDEVTVMVGSEANGGNFGFEPAAVAVSSGTTVTWEWTGEGSSLNVVAENGAFESELAEEAGHTFTHSFDSTGTTKYACTPHKSVGMKGVVVVE